MKKALFIDFDGTICFDRFWVGAPDLVIAWINQNVFQNRTLVSDWMKGFKTSEQINQYIAHGTKYDYDKLWDLFVKGCENFFVEPNVLNTIKQLSSPYKTILMTDNMDCFRRFTLPALKLDTYFDHIAISSNYGLLKDEPTDGSFFKKVAEEQDVSIDDAFFIDNSQRNCDIFETLGGKSFLTNSLEDTKEILEGLKVRR